MEIRQVFRGLRRSPGFTTGAILVLAVGIGANTAVFSVANAVLLRPLPYPDPNRLVVLWEKRVKEGTQKNAVSAADYLDWKAQNRSFAALDAADDQVSLNLTGGGKPERVVALIETSQMLAVYRIQPVLGRGFAAADEDGSGRVVLLSYGLWQRRFGRDTGVIGRKILLNEQPYRILGVMPAGFRIPFGLDTDIYLPLTLTAQERQDRVAHRFLVIGRLRPGVTLAQAQAEMDTISNRLALANPIANTGHSANLVPLPDEVTKQVRPALWMLLFAAGFLLLLAAANTANLLLARATLRKREMAVRQALGASSFQLMRLMLTESLALAIAGGALGVALAKAGLQLVTPWLPRLIGPANPPGLDSIAIDSRVLFFTLAVSSLTGVLFGLVPALQLSRLADGLRSAGRSLSLDARTRAIRRVLVVGEVAISCMLLVGAALLIRSFLKLMEVNPGFQAANRLSIELSLPETRYHQHARQIAFSEELLRRVSALPSVNSAAITTLPPGSTWGPRWAFQIEGQPRPRTVEEYPKASWRVVSDGFFSTMGIPILRGRGFNSGDRADSTKVVLLSEATVKKYFGASDPIGRRIGDESNWRTVIGITGSVKYHGLDQDTAPEFYFPLSQEPVPGLLFDLVVRAAQEPLALTNELQAAIAGVDPELPIGKIQTIEKLIDQSVAPRRFQMMLVAAFAGIALLLAAGGLYSVMAFLVTQRTREIGIRVAVGAGRADVLSLILREGILLGLSGVALGLAAAVVLTRVLHGFLFGISSSEPAIFAGVAFFLLMVALAASTIPARRACRLDPIAALRYE